MNLPLSSLRDYTESELLALPPDSRLLFAEKVHQGLITYDNTSSRPYAYRRVLQPPNKITESQLPKIVAPITALRCISHGMSAFSLHPATSQEHRVNYFLWRAANQVCFDAREAAQLFRRNVFVICIPAVLFDFLTTVTWEQLESALVCVLATLARRDRGLEALKNEIAPSLAHYIDDYIENPDPTAHCCPDVFCLLVDSIMEGISSVRPWIVPTTLAYLSATDMTELLQGRFDRPIFSAPEKFELMHSMMWNIYRDWQTYREVLVKNGRRSRIDALELMAKTISQGTQKLVDHGVRTLEKLVMEKLETNYSNDDACSDKLTNSNGKKRRPNYIARLPADIVYKELMPRVCDTYVRNQQFLPRRLGTYQHIESGIEPWPSPSVTTATSLKTWVLEDHALHLMFHAYDSDEEDDIFDEINVEVDEEEETDSEDDCEELHDEFGDEEEDSTYEEVQIVDVEEHHGFEEFEVIPHESALSRFRLDEESILANALVHVHQNRLSVDDSASGSV